MYDGTHLTKIPEKFWNLPKYTDEIEPGAAVFVVFTIGKYPTVAKYIESFHDLKQYNTTVSLNIFAVIVLQSTPNTDSKYEDDSNVLPEIINLTNTDWILN